jgi:glycosyltransferase involved in cell wall biosynthesis
MKWLKAFLYVRKIDVLYSRPFRLVLGFALYAMSLALYYVDRRRADVLLMKAHHYCDSAALQAFLCRRVKNIVEKRGYVQTLLPDNRVDLDLLRRKYMFLAKPYKGPREKGVIIVTFSAGFNAFFRHYDVGALFKDYYLVLEPEWAGYCKSEILSYANLATSPIIIESPEELDFKFMTDLGSNLTPVEYGCGSWVDFNVFHPIPGTVKKYDCVMVCDWFNYKRHYALFRAMARVKEHGLQAALASTAKGDRENLLNVARYYGVQDNITFLQTNLRPEQVNVLYNESKVNLLLSYKEGANKTLFEGMFAGTPAVLIRNNVGVNKTYINDDTGRLIDERDLPETLVMFAREYGRFSPRRWAMENISCERTTEKLNATLRTVALQRGEEWTEDLRVKVNDPWRMRCLYEKDAVVDTHLDSYLRS